MIGEHLWIANGEGAAKAHRVLIAGPVKLAEVDGRRQRAQPVRQVERGGAAVLVPARDIVPAAPLTPAEEREYDRLDRALAGTIGDTDKLRRFNALRLRSLLFPQVN